MKSLSRLHALPRPVLVVLGSLAGGGLLMLLAGANPLSAYLNLARAGFGCAGPGARCALLTALQFSVPLLLGGLAVTVALRAGFFSLGQPGQMLLGAAAAAWLGARLPLPASLHPLVAMLGAAALGGVWGWVPARLRESTGVNEVIVTLLMNPIAGVLTGLVWLPRIADTARLPPLAVGTKLSAGWLIAVLAALAVYLYLWRMTPGYALRMAGHAPRFALFGGIDPRRSITRAMFLSGALAGLAGAVEVLGVQYRFITSFTAVDNFDGLAVGFVGQLHPLGVAVFAFLLGGLRAGALVGLQIQSGVPRELGGALIALLMIFAALLSRPAGGGKN